MADKITQLNFMLVAIMADKIISGNFPFPLARSTDMAHENVPLICKSR